MQLAPPEQFGRYAHRLTIESMANVQYIRGSGRRPKIMVPVFERERNTETLLYIDAYRTPFHGSTLTYLGGSSNSRYALRGAEKETLVGRARRHKTSPTMAGSRTHKKHNAETNHNGSHNNNRNNTQQQPNERNNRCKEGPKHRNGEARNTRTDTYQWCTSPPRSRRFASTRQQTKHGISRAVFTREHHENLQSCWLVSIDGVS